MKELKTIGICVLLIGFAVAAIGGFRAYLSTDIANAVISGLVAFIGGLVAGIGGNIIAIAQKK